MADAARVLVITGGGCAAIVRFSVFESEPVALMAPIVTANVPNTVGVPEIRPVLVFTDVPAGNPVAVKLVGLVVATI